MRDDRGSATVTACFAMIALIAIVAAAAHLGAVVVARHRAQSAADLAALAAAAHAVTGDPDPCAAARDIAARTGATIRDCRLDGWDVIVTVTTPAGLGAGEATAGARAGPDDEPAP